MMMADRVQVPAVGQTWKFVGMEPKSEDMIGASYSGQWVRITEIGQPDGFVVRPGDGIAFWADKGELVEKALTEATPMIVAQGDDAWFAYNDAPMVDVLGAPLWLSYVVYPSTQRGFPW